MNILVRLPNWLGDFVMSTGFLSGLHGAYPDAAIDVIIKKELVGLAEFVPGLRRVIPFSKAEYPGIRGLWRFARDLNAQQRYDLAIVLPDSFSSALLARFTGTPRRVGFKKELRSFLLTTSVKRPTGVHRVEEYVALLEPLNGSRPEPLRVALPTAAAFAPPHPRPIILNFNSEAESRRIPVEMARGILARTLEQWDRPILLTGSPKETAHTEAILGPTPSPRVTNLAGKTTLIELLDTVRGAALVLSPDSGTAHVANAMGTPLVVLCGASNEFETGPYNPGPSRILRAPGLPCAPCVANTCQFGVPKCMLHLEEQKILTAMQELLPGEAS